MYVEGIVLSIGQSHIKSMGAIDIMVGYISPKAMTTVEMEHIFLEVMAKKWKRIIFSIVYMVRIVLCMQKLRSDKQ